MSKIRLSSCIAVLAALCACTADSPTDELTISIVGTNDLHGSLVTTNAVGGLHVFGGYVQNLRDRRSAEGDAVILLDAGDMWQGTLESNLTEGASVVAAYNSLGYTAAAIGNHDFDFGPTGPDSVPTYEDDDPRGALKARALEANFPLLSANIIDSETGEPVAWPNVSPTTIVEVHGVKVGIVGGTTAQTLATTIADNTRGLEIAPLASSFARFANELRADGADIVVVTVHAGGRCTEFDDPHDLSSCVADAEIFRVANELPEGLVDVIVAGHRHEAIAHFVNGIAIISSRSGGRVFGRVDIRYDRGADEISTVHILAPQSVCQYNDPQTGECAEASNDAVATIYEGQPVVPVESLSRAIESAATAVREYKERDIGVTLVADMRRSSDPDSAIGNLMTRVLLDMSGADAAIHNTVGGIRADLHAGPLTFGEVFELFPFDNRVVTISLTGKELKTVFANQFTGKFRRAGIAGIRVKGVCGPNGLDVTLLRPDSSEIGDAEILLVATNDFIVSGGDGILTPVTPPGGFQTGGSSELFREQIASWLSRYEGPLDPADFESGETPVFQLPEPPPLDCGTEQTKFAQSRP